MLPRIFVQIASYRDPECQWTIRDLFEKAEYPERVFVGVCWQFIPGEDDHCFEICIRPEQVREFSVHAFETRGVCWARQQTQALWRGEEYTLMIDSHMRFAPGWDVKMIEELARCDSPKPLLSCDPPGYTPPHHLSSRPKNSVKAAKPFQADGAIRFVGIPLQIAPEKPLRSAFIAAGFVFSSSDVINEVPYDPYLYFDQEEATYSARLYTHGWDVFCPPRILLYHYYNDGGKSGRPLHWKDTKKWRILQQKGLKRFNHLTGYQQSDDPEIMLEIEKYGMGAVRTFEAYCDYCGIDFRTKHASEKAYQCGFIEDLHKYRNKEHVSIKPSVA